ncbi:hypothetical protein B0H66DRAFT_153079 [Apodospora peruviana]|uniref:Uncharacterized protein n=1 Tax=Apodospora peruviana TaxID=516989 RepID=A0AAE0IJX1_9PEZI|nr:hypothetical protein B0H66DRAFT_153079 [Apodospora peruviana]
MSGGGGGNADTVGALLADIATFLSDSLRILMLADKRQWGPDEFEQCRALEEALDDAKKDYQELAPLVNGQFYYQNDRTAESIVELRALRAKFENHAQNFKDWARQGGPINPIWARDTTDLKRELHRAQCRAARRIFAAEQEGTRCLGAFQVYRQQKRNELERQKRLKDREELPPWQQQHERAASDEAARERGEVPSVDPVRRSSLEELVPCCNAVGKFERFTEHDVAFVCDFCDGFIVWPNLQTMPSARTPLPHGSTYPNWQARGVTHEAPPEEKSVVFAPLAIANHLAPEPGDWRSRVLCPYCDEYTYFDQGKDSEEDVKYAQDEKGFEDLEAFQAHLEWYHTAMAVPAVSLPTLPLPLPAAAKSNCRVM